MYAVNQLILESVVVANKSPSTTPYSENILALNYHEELIDESLELSSLHSLLKYTFERNLVTHQYWK